MRTEITYQVERNDPRPVIPIKINTDLLAAIEGDTQLDLKLSIDNSNTNKVILKTGDGQEWNLQSTTESITTEIYKEVANKIDYIGSVKEKYSMPASKINTKIKQMTLDSLKKDNSTKIIVDGKMPSIAKKSIIRPKAGTPVKNDIESPLFQLLKQKLVHYLALAPKSMAEIIKYLDKKQNICADIIERVKLDLIF